MNTRAKMVSIREATQHGGPGTHWVYCTNDGIRAIEAPDYFLGLQNYVERTHRIFVIAYHPDGSWSEAEFVVMASETRLVVVQQRGEWERFSFKVSRDLKAIDEGAGRFKVVDKKTGHSIARDLDQVSAHALVNAYKGGDGAGDEKAETPTAPEDMTIPDLQKAHKGLTGKGFVVGTPIETMRSEHAAALKAMAPAEVAA